MHNAASFEGRPGNYIHDFQNVWIYAEEIVATAEAQNEARMPPKDMEEVLITYRKIIIARIIKEVTQQITAVHSDMRVLGFSPGDYNTWYKRIAEYFCDQELWGPKQLDTYVWQLLAVRAVTEFPWRDSPPAALKSEGTLFLRFKTWLESEGIVVSKYGHRLALPPLAWTRGLEFDSLCQDLRADWQASRRLKTAIKIDWLMKNGMRRILVYNIRMPTVRDFCCTLYHAPLERNPPSLQGQSPGLRKDCCWERAAWQRSCNSWTPPGYTPLDTIGETFHGDSAEPGLERALGPTEIQLVSRHSLAEERRVAR